MPRREELIKPGHVVPTECKAYTMIGTMKLCLFCAEDIQDAAIVCKHCGRDLKSGAVRTVPTTSPVTKMVAVLFGLAFVSLFARTCFGPMP